MYPPYLEVVPSTRNRRMRHVITCETYLRLGLTIRKQCQSFLADLLQAVKKIFNTFSFFAFYTYTSIDLRHPEIVIGSNMGAQILGANLPCEFVKS